MLGNAAHSYGYCPECGAPGKSRERRLNGDDKCHNGCVYPSKDALASREGLLKYITNLENKINIMIKDMSYDKS